MVKPKLLYIGTFTGNWVSDQFRETGFKRHFDVRIFDYRAYSKTDYMNMNNELFKAVYEFGPDLIFVNKGEVISPMIIKRVKSIFPNCKVFIFNGDQRGRIQDETVRLGSVSDAILINNNHDEQWSQYYDAGVKKIYEYHTATDANTFKNVKVDKKFDVVFAGGHYGTRFPLSKFRHQCLVGLSKNFKLGIAGGRNWTSFSGMEYVGPKYRGSLTGFLNSGRCILGINAFNDIKNYTSNRTWVSMSTGVPYVCHTYAGINNFFKHKQNILVFKTVDQCIETVRWVLKNQPEARKIGMAGRTLVKSKHSYYNRSEQLLEIWKEVKDEA